MNFKQIPAELDVEIVAGDEVSMAITIEGVDLTGYSLSAPIYEIATSSFGGQGGQGNVGAAASLTQLSDTTTTPNWAISAVNLEAGQIALGLSESETSQLISASQKRWYLRWEQPDGYTRTVLSGTLTTRSP